MGDSGGGGGSGDRVDSSMAPTSNGAPANPTVGAGLARSSSVSESLAEKAPRRSSETGSEGEPGRGAGGTAGGAEQGSRAEDGEEKKSGAARPASSSSSSSSSTSRGERAEEEKAVPSIPRMGLLRLLRKQGGLRRKIMESDAVRPILTDRVFTKVTEKNTPPGGMLKKLRWFNSCIRQ